jgi:ATP-dependent helicase HepA
MVTGALELLLGSTLGNSSFALLPDARGPGVLLEASFVLEVVAPPGLEPERFLPAEPLRVVLDARGDDVSADHPAESLERTLRPGSLARFFARPELLRELVPPLVDRARLALAPRVAAAARDAAAGMEHSLGRELARTIALRSVNPSVRAEEVERQRSEIEALRAALAAPRLRLDALRLILAGAR